MRNPDRTKKASTPMNPPSMWGIPPWNIITARTAQARMPSSAGRYARRVCETALSSSCMAPLPPRSLRRHRTLGGRGTRILAERGPRARGGLCWLPCGPLSPTRPLAPPPPPRRARASPPPCHHGCAGPRGAGRRRPGGPPFLAGPPLSPLRARIVAVAQGQVGYATDPSDTYCNKFSAYWYAGVDDCGNDNRSEEWCADFAAWVWKQAGAEVDYQLAPGLPQRRLRQLLRLGDRPRDLAPCRLRLHAAARRRRGLRARHRPP